jgi:VanZ family protein
MSLEELSQWFLPTRSPDLLDWIANLAGAALAQVAAIRMVSWLRPERYNNARAAE